MLKVEKSPSLGIKALLPEAAEMLTASSGPGEARGGWGINGESAGVLGSAFALALPFSCTVKRGGEMSIS
jgi:hypothetical protein